MWATISKQFAILSTNYKLILAQISRQFNNNGPILSTEKESLKYFFGSKSSFGPSISIHKENMEYSKVSEFILGVDIYWFSEFKRNKKKLIFRSNPCQLRMTQLLNKPICYSVQLDYELNALFCFGG